jgi:hypothetical protein
MNWLKENWFKFGILIVIVFLAGYAVYYFSVAIPNRIKSNTVNASKNQLAQDKVKYKDELALAKTLSDDFDKATKLRKETDLRIYAPSFPGYKQEFVDLEVKWQAEDQSDPFSSVKKADDYAAQHPDFAVYHDAIYKQISNIDDWESTISDGKINSSALVQLIESEKLPDEYNTLSQYAEAASKFWLLEDSYFWSEWGYRNLQLSEALNWTEKQKLAKPYPDDIDEQEQAEVLQMQSLQNKLQILLN